MNQTIELYLDFVSPTSYLAYKRIQQLREQFDFELRIKPILLGGLFKAVKNVSPITVPAKMHYTMRYDLPRYAKLYKVEMKPNPNFPMNTLPLMRGAIAAEELGILDQYCDVVFDAMWCEQLNMGDPKVIAERLSQSGIDAEKIIALTSDSDIKQRLIDNTDEAQKRGAFGVPTLFFKDEMYFGQDRVFFIENELKSS